MAGILSSIIRTAAPIISRVAAPVIKAVSSPIVQGAAILGGLVLGKAAPSPSPAKSPNLAMYASALPATIGQVGSTITRFVPNTATKAVVAAGAAGAAYQIGKTAVQAITQGGEPMGNLPRYTGGITDIGVPGPGVFSPTDLTPTMYGGVVKSWIANQALFQKNQNGTITVQKKDGSLKTYRPHKPIVFGKKLDAHKLARVIKKHRGTWKELNKVFGKHSCKTREVRATC